MILGTTMENVFDRLFSEILAAHKGKQKLTVAVRVESAADYGKLRAGLSRAKKSYTSVTTLFGGTTGLENYRYSYKRVRPGNEFPCHFRITLVEQKKTSFHLLDEAEVQQLEESQCHVVSETSQHQSEDMKLSG